MVNQDIGFYIKALSAVDNQTIASALSGDTDGNEIDRDAYNWPLSAVLFVDALSLGDPSDELVFKLETKEEGGTYSDTGDQVTVSNGNEQAELDVDLSGAEKYVRVYLDASASTLAADTEVSVTAVLGGADELEI